jgi:outer membrane receptor protein involved in Fe transport
MINRLDYRARAVFLSSCALFAFATATPAMAQAQKQPAPRNSQNANDADQEAIVITAQKRAEPILKIPQSVTVIGGETLERQNARSFQDYLSQIPGLSLEQPEPGVSRLVLRGVNTGGVSSTVAVYVDETPFGSSTGLVNGAILAGDIDTFDLARIEVLRGPQGTLYGASSLGGVLKFVTNTPKIGELSARGRSGVEFVDGGGTGFNVNGVINVPLGNIAAFRGSLFYRKDAGWIDARPDATFLGLPTLPGKNINDAKIWGGRGSLLIQPTDKLTVRLTAITQDIKSDAPSLVEVNPDDLKPIDGEMKQTVFTREPNEIKYRVYNGILEYDFGFATLLSSTSWNKEDQTFSTDVTSTFGTAFNFFFGPLNPGPPFPFPPLTDKILGGFQDQKTNLSKFTQEFRLTSPSNDRFEWLLGGYYTHEDGLIDQLIGATDFATGERFTDPVLANLAVARLDSSYKEIAGFANATYHFTDRFDLTAGGRLSHNKQSATQSSSGSPLLVGPGSDLPAINSNESVFTYSLSPRFQITPTTAVYARVAKGYRPGGPNVVPPTAPAGVPRSFSADTITSYELGLKTDLGRRLSFDASAYHLVWKDIQLFTQVDNFGVNINGSGAVSNGLEGALLWRPVKGLQLGVNGAYIDAHLTADTPPLVGGSDGDRLPYVPKTSFSLNADYEWMLSSSLQAYLGGTLAYTGTQRDNFAADTTQAGFPPIPQKHIPDYATVDLRGGVNFGRFSLEAYVKNLTNAKGVSSITTVTDALTGANGLPNNAILAALSRPRTIGLTLTAGFGQ